MCTLNRGSENFCSSQLTPAMSIKYDWCNGLSIEKAIKKLELKNGTTKLEKRNLFIQVASEALNSIKLVPSPKTAGKKRKSLKR